MEDLDEAVLDLRGLLPSACARGGARCGCSLRAKSPGAPASVAENSSVWRSAGVRADDALEVGAEAHVHHPVGLVEDEDADAAEVDVAALHEVEQAARRRDQQVGAAGELGLALDADAAVDGGDGEAAGLGDVAGVVDDLAGELARRGEHERRGRGSLGVRRSRIGRTKASVLPEPVGDSARTSWPSSASGMTSVWTAKGAVMPRRASAPVAADDTPRSANVREDISVLLLTSGDTGDSTDPDHAERTRRLKPRGQRRHPCPSR